VKSDNTAIKGPDDLKGKVVAVQLDTTGQEAVENIAGVKEIKKYDGGSEALLATETGKAEATVIDAMVALDYVKQHPSVKAVDRKPFTTEDIAMAIAKENADLQAFANQFVENAKKDGRLDKILEKYGLK
jgi:polar amino acid transport system substrate-binding protein